MKKQTKDEIKRIPFYFIISALVTFFSILIGTVAMIAVFALPLDSIVENVKQSSEFLYNEGEDYSLTDLCMSRLDNFTDSIMLANASYDGDEDLVKKAMNVYMYNLEDRGRLIPLYNYTHNIEKETFHSEPYARYWHGYLVFLKPLLMVTNYQTIRIINLVIQTLLNVIVVALLYKRCLSQYIFPYVLSILFIMPLATAFSLQYATVFYIFSISSILLLSFPKIVDNRISLLLFFTTIGISTAFFDFLTYPIATFGMVAVLYFCMNDALLVKEKIYNGFLIFTNWGFGYAGMWIGKWIVGSLLLKKNVISSAIGSLETRTSNVSGRGEFSYISVLGKNILAFIKTPVSVFAIIFILVMLYLIFIKHKSKGINFTLCVPFIIIAILPLLWYIFAGNHSFLHYQFTYKSLIVSSFAGLCLFANLHKNASHN